MRRTWCLVCLAILLTSCVSKFSSESEELEYLSSLSNPTFKETVRRFELEQKTPAQTKGRQPEDSKARSKTSDDAAAVGDDDRKKVAEQLQRAQSLDSPPDAIFGAMVAYEELIRQWPGTPEARIAADRLEELRAIKESQR
jgi:hypothetical protein